MDQFTAETIGELHNDINALRSELQMYRTMANDFANERSELTELILEARELLLCGNYEAIDWIKKTDAITGFIG